MHADMRDKRQGPLPTPHHLNRGFGRRSLDPTELWLHAPAVSISRASTDVRRILIDHVGSPTDSQTKTRTKGIQSKRSRWSGRIPHCSLATRRAFKTARPLAVAALSPAITSQTVWSTFFASAEDPRSGPVALHAGTLAQSLAPARCRTIATISNSQRTGKRMVRRGQCGPTGSPLWTTAKKSGACRAHSTAFDVGLPARSPDPV